MKKMRSILESAALYMSAGMGFMKSVVEAFKFNLFGTHL